MVENKVAVASQVTKAGGSSRAIKHRNLFLVYLFIFITFGIYFIYWFVSTKNDINSKGGDVPTG